ncbi:hypothetical protein [Nocardia transvalensis]|uniref:hypothetical protein n=1 Tax=Nocardia transvalensis TaxID=37333 RepID=UPI001894C758|nr:hypothetical protein [Nocardia transvalensis]MBF6333363.1 hypothetical protein [Nocardia transvalensis]
MPRPKPQPFTPTRILVTRRLGRGGHPRRWSARTTLIDANGRLRSVKTQREDRDEAIDALLDRLEALGVPEDVLDALVDGLGAQA